MTRPGGTQRPFAESELRGLRERVTEAYRRELDVPLCDLAGAFRDWECHRIDAFELSDLIHKFHKGESRLLWKRYDGPDADHLVAHALALGILRSDEVTRGVPEKLEPIIERYIHLREGVAKK